MSKSDKQMVKKHKTKICPQIYSCQISGKLDYIAWWTKQSYAVKFHIASLTAVGVIPRSSHHFNSSADDSLPAPYVPKDQQGC